MGKFLKLVLGTAVIVTALNFTGCSKNNIVSEVISSISSEKNYVVFDDNKVEKAEVLTYESPYKDASASYYKDKLTDEESELYNIFVYAYEHNYTNIEYYSSNENLGDSYKKIVQCICAENPFIDWNQEYSYTYGSGHYKFKSSQLDKKDVNLKVQAYDKAKEILKSMPEGGSSYDKASWIYNYIVNNVRYVNNSDTYLSGNPSFIYDALMGQETQCTGFSDTMTMMCNLAGVECITVCGQTNEGHAWNLVNIDGNFYYCDATGDSVIKSNVPDKSINLNLSFLKSDEVFSLNGYSLIDNVVIEFPKAKDTKYDLSNIDFNLQNLSNESDLNAISEKLIKEKRYVVVHLQKVSAENTEEVQVATNSILNYISTHMVSNEYSYVTIQNLISESDNDVIFFVNFEK
ncbi:Transglutaminase-like superfamily protein [Clostridium sp. DSM 8431]|uniref:transglutaminase domain-containing protein n=1 Tax=Clostridium sp. DSM 8431 TaxID=1761781 RepID=UPI0008E39D04|nr:transglutaminase domain-containing protein [Clostridium sp. DSM 8431]SFU88981.1 Transglutaminase-like superfamily protein [Clostridium sp. DSM 8431]